MRLLKGSYYRVRLSKAYGGKWAVAEYVGNDEWFLCGNECEVSTREKEEGLRLGHGTLDRVGSAVRLPKGRA
jgi:hypothetical protein